MHRGHSRRIGLVGLVAALVLETPPAFAAAQEPARTKAEVSSILERARRANATSPRATAFELARLGSGSIPALLDALAATRDESAREALLLALEQLPIQELRAQAALRGAGSATDEDRSAAIEALGRCGTPGDLERMIRLAAGATAVDAEDRAPKSLELAAGRLLDRDESTRGRIGALLPQAPAGIRDALFAVVASREGLANLRLLAVVAREAPHLAPLALAHLARCGARAARPVDEEILHVVRSILWTSDSPGLPEAALAAGSLDDYASIPRLIELLDDRRAGVRENAEWSLRRLSGVALLGGADRWRAWYRVEEQWRRGKLPGIERDLASGRKELISLALEEIAGKRCYRHDLARSVSRLLRGSDPEVVTMACDTLRLLRSSAVLDALETSRRNASPAVREAAERALAAIEGDGARRGRSGRG